MLCWYGVGCIVDMLYYLQLGIILYSIITENVITKVFKNPRIPVIEQLLNGNNNLQQQSRTTIRTCSIIISQSIPNQLEL